MSNRTRWAEESAELFASKPLIREFVYRSPVRMDRMIEKEVCDLLIALRGDALLVQMKCQENPLARSGAKLTNWVTKHAEAAFRQIGGAIKTLETVETWSNHPRRGKVVFGAGELRPLCGIVAVESLGEPITLPPAFPLVHDKIPVAYFSFNDLLNVVSELRAFPEILKYLHQRSNLPVDVLRTIGGEWVLFLYYLNHDFSFNGWRSYEDARREARTNDLFATIRAAREGNEGARLIEFVADDLATRASDYLDGMSPELVQMYDLPTQRRNHLRMQEELCDLPLRGRKLLGEQLGNVIQKIQPGSDPAMTYASASADCKPDFLYVVAATRGIHRSTVLKRGLHLLQCGLAHYAKSAGMFVADREGQGFEVAYMDGIPPTPEAIADGQSLFGNLRIFDR
jgi:hypothetical protein